jgi:hypothetical protein
VSPNALLAPPAAPASAAPPAASATIRHVLAAVLPPVLVVLVAFGAAVVEYGRFLENPRHLWTGVIHDRNTHYQTALSLAVDLRQGDLLHFLHDIDAARVWPPLHGFLAAVVMTVGGTDYRLAVLPNLLAWVGTVLLGFLTARRATSRGGTLAGCMAALLILTSTSHRAFAADVMLESLGACLSLLVLYLYLVTLQSTSRSAGRWLAVSLTALFLAKFNYWLLLVLALTAAELTTRPRVYRQLLLDGLRAIDWPNTLRAELRQPLNYVLLVMLGLIAAINLSGGLTGTIGAHTLRLRAPTNLATAAYGVVLFRLALLWRRHRATVLAHLDERAQPLFAWHFWPTALWLLLPKRLTYFLWYLSPAQAGEHPQHGLEQSVRFYWSCLTEDYVRGPVLAILLFILIGVAAVSIRKLRPGSRGLLCLLLIATALTLHHTNRKSRFLHSWIAAGWVLAGVGAARLVHGRLTRRIPAARPWLATAAVGGLAAVCLPQLAVAARVPEGGVKPERVCVLELTDAFLPEIEHSQRTAILSTMPMKFLSEWTCLERYQRRVAVETDVKDLEQSLGAERQAFDRWLATTSADSIVFIDIARTSPLFEEVPVCATYEPLREWLASQTRFPAVRRWRFPQIDCTVTLWSRNAAVSAKR